ncbi:MAG: hypothetical protein ABIH72_02835 [archaeon]
MTARYNIGLYWKGKKQPLEVRKKNSKSLKKAYKEGRHKKVWEGKHFSKEHKEKLRKSNIKTWQDEKLRQKVDKIMTDWWKEHPHIKKARSEQLKKYYKENPKAFKEFMEGGKNSSQLTRKTKFSWKVRSIGEQKIANFLYERKIKAEYEKITLKLDSWLCTPDFYLPSFNVFVEYYGGHPKAEKKKRKKNKLYKKYKIPVIAITPAELRNLDKHLIKDAEKNKSKNFSWRRFRI